MRSTNYITASCIITSGKVLRNDQLVFESPAVNLQEMLLSVYQELKLNYPKFYKMDNLSKLGWLASEVLLQERPETKLYRPEKVGLVIANKNGSLDNDIKYQNTINDVPSPSVFVYTLPNIVIGEICIRNNFKGEHAFFLQENFDAAFICQQADYLLEAGILDRCICGWIDVLGETYKAALFLVDKRGTENDGISLSPENIDRIFNLI